MVLKRFLIAAAAVAAMTAGQAYAAAVEYTVGTGATYRPFEFQNAKKELVGFDIDLVKEIAKAQGFKVKFVNTAWGVIFESLKNGDRDFIISGITITPQRKETIDFSAPYFAAHQLILTQKNVKVKGLADLKGKKVSVVANSAGDIACSKMFGKASTSIKRFDNTPLALEELNAGGVDAAVGDVGVFAYYAQQNPSKHFNMVRDPSFEDQYFGIGVRKGNTKVLKDVNEGLKKVIKSGAYAKVYHKWFGAKAPVPKLPTK
ncbi:basic amino acid ABC transporter substrate-binding protein [Mesosutterella sp. OilRF-GAM-744-9]|uniref:Basic amino acid ABC transporter substrate-binding protein n=2 Tax=Mesosutterella TaxID=2494213 RepID=A0ABS9MPC0_9BURK|nr:MULTISPECIES: basic amino acid ABC transporter substrate-binding protein [unclassified Mesosutterella]MCG5030468.1 basic amino acid ABC transporter substrate-binding protein [Mesosutterella sp. oilRF-744-WT-GAM-9]MDL2059390.1 basic amino acid ABC transporter substrate-binding protein [Mesosutterella sp. AGMB02718]